MSSETVIDEVLNPKLTSWSKEPTVAELTQDLESAKQLQTASISKIEGWLDLLNVTGKEKPVAVKGRSSVQPKLVLKQAEWRYPALSEPFLSSNKMYSVTPATFEDTEGAKQNELLINWQMRTKIDSVAVIDSIVKKTVDEGTCIVRIGWIRETETVTVSKPVYDYFDASLGGENYIAILEKAMELRSSNPRGYDENVEDDIKAAVEFTISNGVPVLAKQVGTTEVKEEKILLNQPTIDVTNIRNIFIDPTCQGDYSKANFVIHTYETSYAELKRNPEVYKNLDKVDWATISPETSQNHTTDISANTNFNDKARRKIVAYEYWGYYDIDGSGKLVPIVATWVGGVMIRMERNPFPDGKPPFVVINYRPDTGSIYGKPDAELIGENQRIVGAITRGMIDSMGKSANAQKGFAVGGLDAVNRRRYENGQDYDFNPVADPRLMVIEHKYPELPSSTFNMLGMQTQEAESITGVKSFSGGITGEAYGQVAAGIRGALDAASKREMAILRRIAKGITEIGEKILSMNAVFLSEKEVVRVTNKEFVEIRREDLAGNYDLIVDISTAEVDNNQANELGFMLQTIGPKVDPMITFMILSEIADLKRMPELAERLRTYRPEPSPEEQEMMQLELEAKRMEVEKLRSEIEFNKARAANLFANTDSQNVNTLDTVSGLKHQRDIEAQQAQSRGNQNLSITKALLDKRKADEIPGDIDAAIGFAQISDTLSGGQPLPTNTSNRDLLSDVDPRYNINSQYYDPNQDPASNLGLNF